MKNSKYILMLIPVIIAAALFFSKELAQKNYTQTQPVEDITKKCMIVASYHKGYKWQDQMDKGIDKVLNGKCQVNYFYMDSKRNNCLDYISNKALEAHNIIQTWKPDVIIAADDNANKHLIVNYYKNSNIPVVFCGINWTADEYGYPFSNMTGMIEISPFDHMIDMILSINNTAKNATIIYPDRFSSLKSVTRIKEIFKSHNINLVCAEIKTMDDFEIEFIKAQQFDFILLANPTTITAWNHSKALEIVNKHSKILSITNNEWVMPYAMLGVTNLAEEHGVYAAQTALKILEGTEPKTIPIVCNRKWQTFTNKRLLDNAEIKLPEIISKSAIDINQ